MVRTSRLLLATALGLVVAAFFAFDLGRFIDLASLAEKKEAIDAYRAAHPLASALGYFAVYVAVAGLSVPGAAPLTLAGSAIFGFVPALLLVSFASSIGATLAFLAARFLFRDWVQERLGDRLATLNAGMDRDGAFYLFAIRLTPVVPFWIVNLAMGLTPMRASTFYWVSQLGMLPGTAVFVYAGAQLGTFRASWGLLAALVLLGIAPLGARRLVRWLRTRRVYARWAHLRPSRFDYNMVVIGGGSAGLVSAYIAATTQARVALVERERMGGDCLNTGCVPSKALLRSARLLADIGRARELGVAQASARVDFAAVMDRVARVIQAIEPHDSVERYTAMGVEVLHGHATVTSPWTVQVAGGEGARTLTTRAIVIATGARPFVPPIPGLDEVGYYTSNTIWTLRVRPERLVVLGGGPIGCELAQAFARLGCRVTVVEMADRLLAREDPDASGLVRTRLARESVQVLTGHAAVRTFVEDGERVLIAAHADRDVRVPFDALLVAVGRVANTTGFGLEELGIATTAAKTIETDEFLQTVYPNIVACGDAAGPFQFTHTAAHQAWYASVNALFGTFRRFRADYRVIPRVTFTDPEVAHVGLTEQEARARGTRCVATVYRIAELDRAITDEAAEGFVKVLTPPGRDTILGATIVGEHAGELIAEYVLAMRHGVGLNRLLGTVHAYPTMAEANKYAAGAWRRAQVTAGQTAWLGAFQAWRRGAGGLGTVVAKIPALLGDKRRVHTASAPQASHGPHDSRAPHDTPPD